MVTNIRLGRFTPEDRRRNIIDVARQVFAREGYSGSSMSGIAAELGGSKATLYKYFDAKDVLFKAVMLECCKDLFIDFNVTLANHRDVRGYLIEAGTKLLSAMLEPSALDISRMVFSEGVRHPEIARIFAESALDPSDKVVAHGLAHFHSIGQIQCPYPIMAAKQFIGMVRADIQMRAISGLCACPSDAEINAHVVGATTIFISGMTIGSVDSVA